MYCEPGSPLDFCCVGYTGGFPLGLGSFQLRFRFCARDRLEVDVRNRDGSMAGRWENKMMGGCRRADAGGLRSEKAELLLRPLRHQECIACCDVDVQNRSGSLFVFPVSRVRRNLER